jgi:hypothetical protein
METTTTMMEPDLPQLRQMVLENTKRINRNEMMIDKMRMEKDEEAKERRERDEWLKNFRKESDESMRQSRERMDRLERFAEISRIENEKRKRELDELIRANEEKFHRELKEGSERFERELKECRDETNAAIRRISIEFLGATGHIVEGLASSAVDKIFKEAGLDLLHYGKNIKPRRPELNGKAEIDVLLGNDLFNVPVEVKADFTKKKVERFVRRMEKFREFFPEYANKEIIAAVAAINYEDGADRLAREEGLLVIRVSSDDVFSLDPFDVKTLRRF